MEKRVYCVKVVRTGMERAVQKLVLANLERWGLEDQISDVLVPTYSVAVKGKEKARVLYPGYVFLEMDLTDKSYSIIKGLPYVKHFLGHGQPLPVDDFSCCIAS